jgi:hypothetical protein
LGVSLPSGSRRVHEEQVTVDADAPYRAIYVSTTLSVDDAIDRFAKIATEGDRDARRFVLPNGTSVVITAPDDVPATRLMPIQPVTEGTPLGTGAWIVLSRGTPPEATWTTAVPPDFGES